MVSFVNIAIAARSTAAAALARTQAQVRATSQAIQRSSFVTRQHTREVILVAGAYRDINGRLRDSQGRWLSEAGHVRHVTTAYGHLRNAIQRTTRALYAYIFANRVANAVSDRMGKVLASAAASMALLGVKAAVALAVLFPLIGTIGNIVPAIMLIAPAAATAGLAMLTLKMATAGFGDAVKAGIAGDTEEFNKALEKLPWSARQAAKTLVDLQREWKRTQKAVQSSFFQGFREDAIGVSRAIQPIADKWLPSIARRFQEVRTELATGLANFAKDGRLEGVTRNLYAGLSSILAIAKPIGRVLGDVLEVAAPRFAALADDARSLAQRFADWIREAKESGKLGEWLDRAISTLGQLKDIATNVGRILGSIFKASGDEGTDMLTQIENATASIAKWANGSEGQGVINFISNLIKYTGQLAPLFDFFAGSFSAVMITVKLTWEGLVAAFRFGVDHILGVISMVLTGAAKAFGWIPGIGPKLQKAAADFENFKNNVNNALNGIEDEVVNITYKSRVIGDTRVSGAQLSGTYSSGIGGRPSGGPGGAPKQINEWGHEIVDFAKGMVYNSNQSKKMMAAVAQGGGGGDITLVVEAAPGSANSWLGQGMLRALHSGDIRLSVGRSNRVMPA